MRRTKTALGLLVCLLCGLHAFDAGAQVPPQAVELKKKGDEAIETLHYDEALAAYKEAYEIGHDPAVQYNMARALEALGDYPAALDSLERFQDTAPDALKARVPHLADRLANLRAHVTNLTVKASVPGARVLLRSRDIGVTPLAPKRVNAGKGSLEVVAEGYHVYKVDVDLPGGSDFAVDAQLASKADSGVLVILSPVVGVDVEVDGKAAGHVPIEVAMKAGSHVLELKKPGYDTVHTSVVVSAGDRRSLTVPLEKQAPITSKWWFWTAAGAVVVAGVVTTYALLTERPADRGTYPPGQVAGPLLAR
jgi:hypothetical protein